MPNGYAFCAVTGSLGPLAPGAQGPVQLECQAGDVLGSVTYSIVDVATGNIVGTDSGGYPLLFISQVSIPDPVTGANVGVILTFRNNGTPTVRVDCVGRCQ
jgi:hypothetical protein